MAPEVVKSEVGEAVAQRTNSSHFFKLRESKVPIAAAKCLARTSATVALSSIVAATAEAIYSDFVRRHSSSVSQMVCTGYLSAHLPITIWLPQIATDYTPNAGYLDKSGCNIYFKSK